MKVIKIKFKVLCCLFIFVQCTYAQLTNLARLEYSFIPQSQSEDRYTRLRALFNYPIKLKNDAYFVIGAEYNRVLLRLEEPYPFETDEIDRFHIIDFSFAYTFKVKDKWRFGLKVYPRIASTLTQSVTSQDFFINGGLYAVKDRLKDNSLEHPFRLIFGLTYNSTAGVPFPLPYVSYYRIINEAWSYTAGIPKSNVKYTINEKNVFQAFVSLDGFYAHIQEPLIVNDAKADHISLSVVVGGLGYDYKIADHLFAFIYTGYTFRLNNVLRDENRNEIYKLDDINAPYLRTGVKLKI